MKRRKIKKNKKIALFTIVFVVVLAIGVFVRERIIRRDLTCKGCNIVIIDLDVLRADALPCYGYHRETAPNVCSLVNKGVIFERNYSQNNWTLPGITSTFTSLYPSAHKVRFAFIDKISPEIKTMAEMFKQEGYNTVFVGPDFNTFNFYPLGIERGFDKMLSKDIPGWKSVVDVAQQRETPFFIYFQTQRLNMPYTLEKQDEVQLLESLPKPANFPQTKEEYRSLVGDYLIENYQQVFTKKAIDDNPQIFKNLGPDTKLKLLELFWSVEEPSGLLIREKWRPVFNSYFGHIEKGGEPALKYLRLMYDTNIALVDKELQPLLSYLKSLEDTIVILMSQHGEEFREHGYYSHQTLYNEVLNTPLIISAPRIRTGRIDQITQNIDILPTLMELISIPVSEQAQGESLVPFLKGEEDMKGYAVSEIPFKKASIQDYRWKLTYNYNNEDLKLELFDLLVDPKEQENLATQNEETAEKLLSKLRIILKESRFKYEITQPSLPE